jgi:hypothetical protein
MAHYEVENQFHHAVAAGAEASRKHGSSGISSTVAAGEAQPEKTKKPKSPEDAVHMQNAMQTVLRGQTDEEMKKMDEMAAREMANTMDKVSRKWLSHDDIR